LFSKKGEYRREREHDPTVTIGIIELGYTEVSGGGRKESRGGGSFGLGGVEEVSYCLGQKLKNYNYVK